jgi:tyrosyl-tRNA synthetase
MEAKKRLARTVTEMYHGETGAADAEAHFARVVQGKELPEKIDKISYKPPSSEVPVWRLLKDVGLVTSSSEARRMIQQGAVEVDGVRISDDHHLLSTGREYLVRVGKRRFKQVDVEQYRV